MVLLFDFCLFSVFLYRMNFIKVGYEFFEATTIQSIDRVLLNDRIQNNIYTFLNEVCHAQAHAYKSCFSVCAVYFIPIPIIVAIFVFVLVFNLCFQFCLWQTTNHDVFECIHLNRIELNTYVRRVAQIGKNRFLFHFFFLFLSFFCFLNFRSKWGVLVHNWAWNCFFWIDSK